MRYPVRSDLDTSVELPNMGEGRGHGGRTRHCGSFNFFLMGETEERGSIRDLHDGENPKGVSEWGRRGYLYVVYPAGGTPSDTKDG